MASPLFQLKMIEDANWPHYWSYVVVPDNRLRRETVNMKWEYIYKYINVGISEITFDI